MDHVTDDTTNTSEWIEHFGMIWCITTIPLTIYLQNWNITLEGGLGCTT